MKIKILEFINKELKSEKILSGSFNERSAYNKVYSLYLTLFGKDDFYVEPHTISYAYHASLKEGNKKYDSFIVSYKDDGVAHDMKTLIRSFPDFFLKVGLFLSEEIKVEYYLNMEKEKQRAVERTQRMREEMKMKKEENRAVRITEEALRNDRLLMDRYNSEYYRTHTPAWMFYNVYT
jgi:hypothetical protein